MTETIKYSKIYKEDLATGSGTEYITLPDGKAVALTRINIKELCNITFSVGSLLVVDSATTVAVLPAVAANQVLLSAGLLTAPAYTASPTLTTITCRKLLVTDASGNVLHAFGDTA
jgi:hypothetical protein